MTDRMLSEQPTGCVGMRTLTRKLGVVLHRTWVASVNFLYTRPAVA